MKPAPQYVHAHITQPERSTMKKIMLAILALGLIFTISGCAKRRIDVEETGSKGYQGTSWKMFCDGPNAVIWVPGYSGEDDELEAYVYEHWQCAPKFYADGIPPAMTTEDPAKGDPDGIIEDDEE